MSAVSNFLDTWRQRAMNELLGVNVNDPKYREKFAAAFKIDPATQSLWNNAQRYANLTDEQKQAALISGKRAQLDLRGVELDQNIDHQLKAADVTAKINADRTANLGERTEQGTRAYLTKLGGPLTQSQAELIRVQGEQQRALQNDLIAGVVPAVLAHEKELAAAERNPNVLKMLGGLVPAALALFA